MMPETFTITMTDDQRNLLIVALRSFAATNAFDCERRDELRDMLLNAESGDTINDFTL